jgi:uncharacterized tellurite resistance protein B-like protein
MTTIASRRWRCSSTPPPSTAMSLMPSARSLHVVIKRQFALDEATTDELVAEATEAEHEAIDLYHFTSLINGSLDEEGRRRVVEMMWEIAYADGDVDEFERNLIWRAADLLGVSSRERIELGQRVAGRRGTP